MNYGSFDLPVDWQELDRLVEYAHDGGDRDVD